MSELYSQHPIEKNAVGKSQKKESFTRVVNSNRRYIVLGHALNAQGIVLNNVDKTKIRPDDS